MDCGRKLRAAERGDYLGSERHRVHALKTWGATVELWRRRSVDDIGVEFVGGEARVVGSRRNPNLEPFNLRQQAAQSGQQPLRGETGGAVQAQQQWPAAGGNVGDAELEFPEATFGVLSQHFA